ncbi:hypothetical protein SAY87_023073 [Trapa incisa]|uniref:Uncharacterized protein n=1 Tax=Trapa incisa TaxID=236973 RepID=A0AAN7K5D4_9MYRT|nr:hypothetical protein SAY87_023073 [Trapa incisa]
MIRLQLDIVDKKVESGIGALRNELSKKIEDKTVILELELKTLEAKANILESYLSELKGKEWLSDEDFYGFVKDLKKTKMSIGSSEVMILGDVKDYARDIVLKEIEKLWANGLARALCHFLWRGICAEALRTICCWKAT